MQLTGLECAISPLYGVFQLMLDQLLIFIIGICQYLPFSPCIDISKIKLSTSIT